MYINKKLLKYLKKKIFNLKTKKIKKKKTKKINKNLKKKRIQKKLANVWVSRLASNEKKKKKLKLTLDCEIQSCRNVLEVNCLFILVDAV